ncbi:pilin [Patescibacteria group bacterium]|nr:pilin [Patescibacteria group bacterium]
MNLRNGAVLTSAFFALTLIFVLSTPLNAQEKICCLCAPKDSPADKACITGEVKTCEELISKSKNKELSKVKCESLVEPEKCRPKGELTGICAIGPINEGTYSTAASSDAGSKPLEKPVIPDLMVDIPGLTFSNKLEERGTEIEIPFLAQYIAAVYRYLTGVAIVAAAVMIVYGGFLYIVGSTMGNVQKGKKLIADAIIGLILVLGAYTILNTLNPDLLKLDALKLTVIKPFSYVPDATYQRTQTLAHASGYKPEPDVVSALKTSTGGSRPPASTHSDTPLDSRIDIPRDEIFKILEDVAKKINIDPCIPKAILATESGFKNNAIGHDEDAPVLVVQARLDFLRSGKKYSGATFEPPKDLPDNCTKALSSICTKAIKRTANIRNDDTFKPTPPFFGLDWRFPHGIGSAQCTIFPPDTKRPHCYGPNGEHGRPIGGTCYTVPILMTWEGQMECMMKLLKAAGAKTPCGYFKAFGGITTQDPDCTGTLLSRKMKAYNNCKAGRL